MFSEEDTCFHLRFVYVHSVFSANKGMFISSKQKVIKSHLNNCGFISPHQGLKICQPGMISAVSSIEAISSLPPEHNQGGSQCP